MIIDRVSPLVASGLKEYGVEVDIQILPGVEELKQLLPNYDLLVMRVDPKIDRELLDAAAKRVKMIAVCAVGTNHIDVDYAGKLGIKIQNAPGVNYNAVAELTISKMLDLSRFTMEANREVQEEHIWNKYKYTGHELKGHVLGIVGLGKIGSRVAKLAQAFDMTVAAYDPYVDGETMQSKGVAKVEDLNELCARADYISTHTPLTSETKGIIGKEQFACMKPGTYVINCARGGVVDEAAAREALASGKVAAYVVDFPCEEVLGMEGAIVLPHLGASTPESEDNCAVMAADELIEYLENGNIRNSVNYPAVEAERTTDHRICVLHKNVPTMLTQISGMVSEAGVNIDNMTSRSKKDYAYTILDVTDAISEGCIQKAIRQMFKYGSRIVDLK